MAETLRGLEEKKLILRCGPLCRLTFKFEYPGKYEVEFESNLGYETGAQVGYLW
jgi:hypothetical protein